MDLLILSAYHSTKFALEVLSESMSYEPSRQETQRIKRSVEDTD
jgi:hypothetical protein